MINQNTRRGNAQEVVHKKCHSKFNLESHHVLLSKVRSRIKYGMTPLFDNNRYAGDPRVLRAAISGMTSLYDNGLTARGFTLRPSSSRSVSMRDIGAARRGFTLIELLVVVLIIGILAAVALPQYQQAVYKARAAQFISMLNAYKKVVDVYVLERGYQNVTILGEADETYPLAELLIDFPTDQAQKLVSYYKGNGQGGNFVCDEELCSLSWAGDTCDFMFQKDPDHPEWFVECNPWTKEGEVLCKYLEEL